MTEITITISSILAVFAAISTISGTYLKLRKISKDRQKQLELERAIILQEAKENSNKHKLALEAKIELLENDFNSKVEALSQKINNVEESINKDLTHIKESYANEVRFLGSKIEELRDEMRVQMSQVVQLVSKLIDKT